MSAVAVILSPQGATASTEYDWVSTPDGASVGSHGTAAAALLPAATELVAIVPAPMLSWHKVELPKGTSPSSPRVRAVLEGLLEDQLLDEPEAVHFALQPRAGGAQPLWVAACDRNWLRESLHTLEEAGRAVSRVVPEFAPEGDMVLHAVGEAQHPLLVAVSAEGVTLLPLASASAALLPPAAQGAPCISEPAVSAIAEQVLHRAPALQQAPARWLRAAQSEWDLAQFEFAQSARARTLKRLGTAWSDLITAPQWRPARWGALALVVLNVVGLNAWAWRERAALETKRQAIGETLTKTFPQVKVVVDAPVQMEREVAALRQATGATSGRDLESLLAALAAAAPAQRAVQGIDFIQGQVRVRGLALSPDEMQSAAATLRAQGYAATQQGDQLVVSQEGAQ